MKTDEVRQRIARQPKRHARTVHAKNQRSAGTQVDLVENDFKAERFQQRVREVFFADARAAGNQQHVRI